MKIIAIIAVLMLSGCAGEFYPISDETIQQAGQYTRDASVAKEEAVHKTLRHQDTMIRDSNSKPSFELSWVSVDETVFYPGMAQPITVKKAMPKVAYTEKQDFQQRPQAPSVHPLWRTLEVLGGAAIQWTGIFGLADQAAGVLGTSIKNSRPEYNGPYNPQNYDNSFNQTAKPYAFGEGAVVQ